MEPGPAAHVAQGGSRPCESLRGRQGAAGQSRAAPDAATPPARFWAAARRAAAPRPEQSEAPDTPAVLCVPHAPRPGSGGGGARPGGSPHAARGLSREQSAAARSRRHVPRPRRAQPAPQEHGGGAAAPAEPARPSRAALVASARPGSAPSRRRAQASRAARGPLSRLAHEGSCPRGCTQSPRGVRVAPQAPSPRSSCVPAPARARTKFGRRRLPPTPRLPPARAQVPRGRAPSRPAACPMCRRRRRFVLEAL